VTRVWLSLFCCDLFLVEPDSDTEKEAIRKGLILVPADKVDEVNDMTKHGRRRWGQAYVAAAQ
jgi:hypothetical protein